MKTGFLDKLMERLDRIDPGSLQTHFLRLAREKGLLETIFHAVREGIIVVDGAGRISYANRAAEQLLGFQTASAAGQPIQKYLRAMDWESLLRLDPDEWSRLVAREIEISYPERRVVDFYVVPLAAVAAKEAGAVLLLRDVTREREHEVQTVESERIQALTLLAAGVAHEIGNPLNSLNIHLQLIAREAENLPEAARANLAELIDVSRREVTRLDGILTQFLRAIRPNPPSLAPASAEDIVRETVDFLQHEIRDRDVLVEIESPEDLPRLMLDANQIKQVFFNIIRNAIQAMPGGGLLKIILRATDDAVAVSFSDNGVGIPPEEISHLFEAYHTTRTEGTGLGLMIVQRIVRDHGGQIEVHSEPGRGTTFTVILPRDDRRIRLLKAHRPAAAETTETIP